MRRLLAPVAAIALAPLLGFGACSDADDRASTPTTVPTIGLDPSTTTTTPEDAALADLLLTETGTAFATVATEAIDLDTAAALDADADADGERSRLEDAGFVRGVARTWASAMDDVVYIAAYELGSSQQAARYLADATRQVEGRGAERFDVPDVPGAVAFTTTEPEFVAHAVAFTRDARWFLVLVGSATGSRTAAEAAALATAQAARVE